MTNKCENTKKAQEDIIKMDTLSTNGEVSNITELITTLRNYCDK